jgi:hypothetical protein
LTPSRQPPEFYRGDLAPAYGEQPNKSADDWTDDLVAELLHQAEQQAAGQAALVAVM